MDQNKRLLVAVVLTFLIISVWGVLFPPSSQLGPLPEGPRPPQAVTPADAQPPEVAAHAASAPEAVPESYESAIEDETEREIVIRTPRYAAVFSSKGAMVRSWTLNAYRERPPLPGEEVGPVELVPTGVASDWFASGLGPLAVITGNAKVDERLATAFYTVQGASSDLGSEDVAVVTFLWGDGAGTRIEKRLEFRGASYVVGVTARITIPGHQRPILLLGPGFVVPEEAKQSGHYGGRAAILPADGKVAYVSGADIALKKISKATDGTWPPSSVNWLDPLLGGEAIRPFPSARWAALDSNYFTALAYGTGAVGDVLVIPIPEDLRTPPRLAVGIAAPPAGLSMNLYVGPKDGVELRAIREDLESIVGFGFFAPLAKVLLVALQFFQRYVLNYGIAIILVTVVVKVLFFPITYKQLEMAQKMAKLRPQMKQIEDKYSRIRDPKGRLEAMSKRQAEVAELYRAEGVNTMSGCLPLLLQLPVLAGFYSLLSTAIKLRHAPFVLWIQDLSAKDPFYVTPVLMMISMLVLQAITPSAVDASQRRMMTMMSVVMMVFFVNVASGLVLYWLTQNVLSIGQQGWMNRLARRRDQDEKDAKRQTRGKRSLKGAEE